MNYLFDWAGSYVDGAADKVWRIVVYKTANGFACARYWGRRGKPPKSMVEEFLSEYAAMACANKLMREKVKKGYENCAPGVVKIIGGATVVAQQKPRSDVRKAPPAQPGRVFTWEDE